MSVPTALSLVRSWRCRGDHVVYGWRADAGFRAGDVLADFHQCSRAIRRFRGLAHRTDWWQQKGPRSPHLARYPHCLRAHGRCAIFGIVTVLRLDFTGYAIRYLSIGEIFHVETKLIDGTKQTLLKSEAAAWYDTILGQGLGYGAYIILALACYFLARWGAEKELASSAPDTSDESRDQASS